MSTRLVVPPNIISLPPKCPELDPVENVWQFIRDHWLSNRVFKSCGDLVDHCAKLGRSSPISPGGSCRSDCDSGRTGSKSQKWRCGTLIFAKADRGSVN
jgi:hypothetical protein